MWLPTIQVEYRPIVHLPSCSRKTGGLSCLCSLLPQSGKLVHLGYNGLLSHQYVVHERLWGVGLQHGFPLAPTAAFWKPVVHYNKGKLNIFNWVYWRSIGLSLTSVGLLGSMSHLNILPNTNTCPRHCSLLSLFMFTFTLIYFSATLGCMCFFLAMGFTWVPSVYKLFSHGAPQVKGFSVSQSNCMVASMD